MRPPPASRPLGSDAHGIRRVLAEFWGSEGPGVGAGGALGAMRPEPRVPHTLLHVVYEGLQLRVGLRLLTEGVQEQVVLGGARNVRLPQPSLQQPDLGLLLGHLQPLRAGSRPGDPFQPGAVGTPSLGNPHTTCSHRDTLEGPHKS